MQKIIFFSVFLLLLDRKIGKQQSHFIAQHQHYLPSSRIIIVNH